MITLMIVVVTVDMGGMSVLLMSRMRRPVMILKLSYLHWPLRMVIPQHLLDKQLRQSLIPPLFPQGRTLLGVAMTMVFIM